MMSCVLSFWIFIFAFDRGFDGVTSRVGLAQLLYVLDPFRGAHRGFVHEFAHFFQKFVRVFRDSFVEFTDLLETGEGFSIFFELLRYPLQ
jgi:hypothetical protein